MKLKSVLYKKEQDEICDKIISILNLDGDKSITLYELDNDKVKLKDDKIYINQTTLLKIKKFSVPVVKRYLNNNKEILNQHHSKHDLTPNHNRDVANSKKTKVRS
jgi:hypothetical protein